MIGSPLGRSGGMLPRNRGKWGGKLVIKIIVGTQNGGPDPLDPPLDSRLQSRYNCIDRLNSRKLHIIIVRLIQTRIGEDTAVLEDNFSIFRTKICAVTAKFTKRVPDVVRNKTHMIGFSNAITHYRLFTRGSNVHE